MRRAGFFAFARRPRKGYRTVDTSKKTAVKIPHVKARASKVASEISDRDQIEIEHVGASYFLQSRDFARGVQDVRAGRPPRFDDYAWDQGGMPATDRRMRKGGNSQQLRPDRCLCASTASSISAHCGFWWRQSIAET
jgi:hypothetical protein